MGGQIIDIIRQGIWASLTGGWFIDPHLSKFCNTFHLYTWLLLLLLPFVLSLVVTSSTQLPVWAAYCTFVALAFSLLKFVNYRLHVLFDTTESVEAKEDGLNSNVLATLGGPSEPEVIELTELVSSRQSTDGGTTATAVSAAASEVPSLLLTREGDLVQSTAATVHRADDGVAAPGAVSATFSATASMAAEGMPSSMPSSVVEHLLARQRRWPDSPSLLKGGTAGGAEAMYSSHRTVRRRNAVRRRTKSALDAPRMLVSECRTSEDPPLRLEWSGSPHPSPRPRQRLLSLHSEPLAMSGVCGGGGSQLAGAAAACSGRRSSWELRARRQPPVLRHHHSDIGQRFPLPERATRISAAAAAAAADFLLQSRGSAVGGAAKVVKEGVVDGAAKDFLDKVKANKTFAEMRRELSGQWMMSDIVSASPATAAGSESILGQPHSPADGHPAAAGEVEAAAEEDVQVLTACSSYGDVFNCDSSDKDEDEKDEEDDGNNNVFHASFVTASGDSRENQFSHRHSSGSAIMTGGGEVKSAEARRGAHREAFCPRLPAANALSRMSSGPSPKRLFASLDTAECWGSSDMTVPSTGAASDSAASALDQWLSANESTTTFAAAGSAMRWREDRSTESVRGDGTQEVLGMQESLVSHPPHVRAYGTYSTTQPAAQGSDDHDVREAPLSVATKLDLKPGSVPPDSVDVAGKSMSSANPSPSSTASTGSEVVALLSSSLAGLTCRAGTALGRSRQNAESPHSRRRRLRHAGSTPISRPSSRDAEGAAGPASESGKLHYFKDEEGDWWVYSFGPNAQPRNLGKDFSPSDGDSSGSDSGAAARSSQPVAMSLRQTARRSDLTLHAAAVPQLSATDNQRLGSLSLIERDSFLIDDLIGRDSSGELLGRLQTMMHGLQQQQDERQQHQQRRRRQADDGRETGEQVVDGGDERPQDPVPWLQPQHRHAVRGASSTGSRTTSSSSGSDGAAPDIRETESVQPAAPVAPKHYYTWNCLPRLTVRIWLDRLSLLSLMDRNASVWENIASIVLVLLVAILASLLLARGFFNDVWILIFCTVTAGCQYSLLKSVQPDAASPTHGYNRVIVFSRAFYFCACASSVLALDLAATRWDQQQPFVLYGLQLVSKDTLLLARDALTAFLLCLPIVFTLGLLPQVTTFLQFLFEQVEIHVFGGNGTSSPLSSLYAVLQSSAVVAVLFAFCVLPVELTYAQDPARWTAKAAKHITFSVFCGVYVALSYHASRLSSDPTHVWSLIKHCCFGKRANGVRPRDGSSHSGALVGDGSCNSDVGIDDPLPRQLLQHTTERMRANLIVSILVAIFVFGIHVSTVFSALQPTLNDVLCILSASLGFLLHYVMAQLRKEYPWLCCSRPVLETHERRQFEVKDAARIMRFEKTYVWLCFLEKNIVYPVLLLSALTVSAEPTLQLFGRHGGPLVLAVCAAKVLRSSYSDASRHCVVVAFTTLFFKYDWQAAPERSLVLLNYFVMLILYSKFYDFYTKIKFVLVYIAPWQLAWGSAFHAFAQPLSVPHSVMLFAQAALSAIFSTPLNPFLGSAIFITSYCRPVKFWEKDYNTKRVDHSNTRLASQLEHDLGTDDNNLNSVFYEHLTRTLQRVLCGDLMMGRWGQVAEGDMFIMASDYLNAMVHIVEMGNGLVTFQLRGLEFRGTYCQQREVEAITEGIEDDRAFCCCRPGHLPRFLSLNAAFSQRWLAWEVTVAKYVLEGYSISDNSAASMLQMYDLRLVLLTYYVKSAIYYAVRSPRLEHWLAADGGVMASLIAYRDESFIDLDHAFNANVDVDYDVRGGGMTRESFCGIYLPWIRHCAAQRLATLSADAIAASSAALASGLDVSDHKSSPLVLLCFGLSLLARRALATASHNNYSSASVEFFLFGLHALFKGDFRITNSRDEWVLSDVELLRRVVSPAIRMALKLHQDHFTSSEEYDDCTTLYDAIFDHERDLVISHEADPMWRSAILAGRPSLLALRHVFDEGSDEYKIIMLNKRYLSFRIIKVNRECVRGLWAGQQQELVFLRNRNPERGSIQNAKQALRNMINSSCDQPIGYPIYVSPLTTSYSGSNPQLCAIIGHELSLRGVQRALAAAWKVLRRHCGGSHGHASLSAVDAIEMRSTALRSAQPVTLTGIASMLPPPVTTGTSEPTTNRELSSMSAIGRQVATNHPGLLAASGSGKPSTASLLSVSRGVRSDRGDFRHAEV